MQKDLELKLLIELIKDSRRSDKELSKELGISPVAVKKLILKLEKEGIIKEYTIIPDFTKIGFEIMSITFAKMKDEGSKDELEAIGNKIGQLFDENPPPSLISMGGIGIDPNRVFLTVHRNYGEYSELFRRVKRHPQMEALSVKSFLIDLSDRSHFCPFSFSELAKYLSKHALKE